MKRIAAILLASAGTIAFAIAQPAGSCQVSFPLPATGDVNIFSPAQEFDLGDAIAESTLLDVRIVAANDPWIQRIAERLVRGTALRDLHIRTNIIDFPQANAFILPGGRVYISRALIALLDREDELAGIMAHEFGHLLARQQSIRVSRYMKAVLDVNSVSDRRDIFDKFSRMNENLWRKPGLVSREQAHEERDQLEADRLGLLIQAAAGYDPAAQISAFDRLAETGGKGGNFFSNLFDPSPNRKRLGEMLKSVPAGCATATAATAAFADWRTRILNDAAPVPAESLHNIRSRLILRPPLRGDLSLLRFSPDGRMVLAQDPAGITVFSVQPFRPLFRIRAELAGPASFTPDSKLLAFASPAGRVERWDAATGRVLDVAQVAIRRSCLAQVLSPDGSLLACVDRSGDLQLIEVGSGESKFEKKSFAPPVGFVLQFANTGSARMQFSPDGRFFLAVPGIPSGAVFAWDVRGSHPVPVKGELKKFNGRSFTFVAPDRVLMALAGIMGVNQTASLVSFPSGEVIERPTLPSGPLSNTANPAFVRIAPLGKYASGIVEYSTGEMITNKAPALDISGRIYVAERTAGELALYERGKGVLATAALPEPELTGVRALAVSPDLDWLAVSTGVRAAVWNLSTGQSVGRLSAFDGGFFDAFGRFIADAPKSDDRERHIIDIKLNPIESKSGPEVKSQLAKQAGPWMFDIRREDGAPPIYNWAAGGLSDVVFDVSDARTMKSAWSRKFQGEAPVSYFEPSSSMGVFLWNASSERVKRDAALRDVFARLSGEARSDERTCLGGNIGSMFIVGPQPSGAYLAETFDIATGEVRAAAVINLVDRCRRIKNALPIRGAVVVEDNQNHILVFSGNGGEPKARIFGRLLAVDPVGSRVAVGKETGRFVIYNATGVQSDEFNLSVPIVAVRFSADGRLVLALTSKEEAVVMALSETR